MKLLKSLKKFIKANHIIAILGLFVLIVAINQFSTRKSNVTDNMHGGKASRPLATGGFPEGAVVDDDTYATVQPSVTPPGANVGGNPTDTASPNELLPNSGAQPEHGSMLSAGHNHGIDTVGGSRGNANLQLRADPVIQKVDVGPWGQSTFEQDTTGLVAA